MSMIPEDKLQAHINLNLTPMLDFLFLMLAFFALLAISRSTLLETKLELVKLQPEQNSTLVLPKQEIAQINLLVSKEGSYKWITDIQQYSMETTEKIQNELLRQYQMGILPEDKTKTQVLLHVDKHSPWQSIAKLIFSIRQIGFEAYPIYEPESEISSKLRK